MSFADIQGAIMSCAPAKGKRCELCGAELDKLPSICVSMRILLKKIEKGACVVCAKEIRALLDLRITQAEKGEHQ